MKSAEQTYRDILAALPTRAPIFLPTERISLEAKNRGLAVVRDIYKSRLDAIYRPKLRALREQYVGRRRCFVIGNGPSLNRTDLSCLKDECTFAVNGFFLKARELDWTPTFYCVEDHLVAEDRREWINAFEGPIKLFPVYLAYCLEEGPNTIFYNHRPRKSFPHGFDFSTEADQITYTGGTVTFSCLQLAHYLGFEEIYLIGVDADYDVPKDTATSNDYGTAVLDMKSDDPNHFHPDYFGKGFRWHDPNVDRMIAAYEEARRVTDATGRHIYNAGIGGKLEAFERRPFRTLFPRAKAPETLDAERARAEPTLQAPLRHLPRCLLLDHTRNGDGTATGEVKSALFADWPADRLLQVHQASRTQVAIGAARFSVNPDAPVSTGLAERIAAFRPEVILYRPVPDTPALHPAAMRIIRSSGAPLVTWIMDDWPAHLASHHPADFAPLDRDWRALLAASARCFSIGPEMTQAFSARYGCDFMPFANGVDPKHWPRPRTRPPGTFKVRYAGSLADNMCLDSVVRVAQAVEQLAASGIEIEFKIKTRPLWHSKAEAKFAGLTRTSFLTDDLTQEGYREWLSDADVLVIAYNFDPKSVEYTRYSVANKLPECLASGAVVLAHGPKDVATIHRLSSTCAAEIVAKPSVDAVTQSLLKLTRSPFLRLDLSEAAQKLAFSEFNIQDSRARFADALRAAARSNLLPELQMDFSRDDHVHLDEVDVIATMLSGRNGPQSVMIDVGAHFGNSAARFVKLGWSIHCFEPDPANRAKLIKRLGASPQVVIDPRAVSDRPARGVSLFTSAESSGISGLMAFHHTHVETAKADVTTISEIVSARGIEKVDFLKVDVEGFDFNVLKGVPWERIQPDVILCEFEDAKTIGLGHTWKEIAAFLKSKDYAVYLSEWHPIVRYGRRHDWRRVMPLEDAEMRQEAWGNILAFRVDPGRGAVHAAFMEATRAMKTLAAEPSPEHAAPALSGPSQVIAASTPHAPALSEPDPSPSNADPTPTQPPPSGPGYASRVATLLGFADNVASSMWRRRAVTMPAFTLWAAWMASGLIPAMAPYRWVIWSLGAYALLAAAIVYVALRARQFIVRLGNEAFSLRQNVDELRRELSAAKAEFARQTSGAAEIKLASLRAETDTLRGLIDRQTQDGRSAEARIATIEETWDPSLRSLKTLSETLATQEASIEARAMKLREEFRAEADALRAMLDRYANHAAATEREFASLRADADALRAALGEQARDGRTAESRFASIEARTTELRNEFRAETDALRTMLDRHANHAAAAEGEFTALRAEADALRELIDRQADVAAGAEARIATLQADLEDASAEARIVHLEQALLDETEGAKPLAIAASKDIASLQQRASELSELLDRQDRQLARTFASASFNNASWYQRFNRQLTKEHIEALLNLAADMPIRISQQTIGYMAHRICTLEAQMHGRLATSVEDMLLRIFAALSARGRKLRIIEIGTLFGVGAGILYDAVAPHFDSVHITLLDPLDGYYDSDRPDILTGQPVTEHTMWRNLAAAGVPRDNVTLLKYLSSDKQALEEAGRREYDVLIIDGDHSYDGVKIDYELYEPLVRKGGVIVFDDYGSPDWPDVQKYVDTEVAPRRNVKRVYQEWRTCVYRVTVSRETMNLSADLARRSVKLEPTSKPGKRARKATH